MIAGKPSVSIRRVHAEPARGHAAPAGARAQIEDVAWLALWDDRTITHHASARALLREVHRRDRRDAARAARRGAPAIFVTFITWNQPPPGFVPPTEDASWRP